MNSDIQKYMEYKNIEKVYEFEEIYNISGYENTQKTEIRFFMIDLLGVNKHDKINNLLFESVKIGGEVTKYIDKISVIVGLKELFSINYNNDTNEEEENNVSSMFCGTKNEIKVKFKKIPIDILQYGFPLIDYHEIEIVVALKERTKQLLGNMEIDIKKLNGAPKFAYLKLKLTKYNKGFDNISINYGNREIKIIAGMCEA